MPADSYGKLNYQPIGGVNLSDSPDMIGEQQCADTLNFLFDSGLARTRPGVNARVLALDSAPLFCFEADNFPVALGIVTLSKLYRLTVNGTVTEITGPTIGGMGGGVVSANFINGVFVIGGIYDPGGQYNLYQWDPDTTVFTKLTGAPYLYCTGHLSRAVACNSVATYNGSRTVAWSVAGDVTDWTGPGSGSAVLPDEIGGLTGISMIRNMIVVLGSQLIYLGYPTGTSLPAYRFETYMRGGVAGARSGAKPVAWNNVVYFKSNDHDIHSFDGQSLTSVGGPIRKAIADPNFLNYQTSIVINRDSIYARAYLCLTSVNATGPVYMMDIESGAWTKHSYAQQITTAAQCAQDFDNLNRPVFLGATRLFQWDEGVPCELAWRIQGRKYTVGESTETGSLKRVLVQYRSPQDLTMMVTVQAMLNRLLNQKSTTITTGSFEDTGNLVRDWANLEVDGQHFSLSIDGPGGASVQLNLLSGLFASHGRKQ